MLANFRCCITEVAQSVWLENYEFYSTSSKLFVGLKSDIILLLPLVATVAADQQKLQFIGLL